MSDLQVRIVDELPLSSSLATQWEALVRATPASGFMQSLHWAAFKRRQGLSSFHLVVVIDGELLGGGIFYSSRKRNGAGILVAPEGPVLPWDNQALATRSLGLIIDTIQAHSTEWGVMAMRIEPRLLPPPIPALREFGRAPADLIPRDTLYIDLALDEQSLLNSMKAKGRYNIGLSQRHGVQVFEDSSAGAAERFYAVMQESSQRDDFALEPYSFFAQLASELCPTGCARFLFAEHDGDTLGTLLLMTYGNRGTYLYGGITNNKRNLMGGYALQWKAMNLARAAGCTTYDFYGFDPFQAPQNSYARFSQFKSQFGGSVRRFIGAQDHFFLDNLADAFIKVVKQTNDLQV